MRPSVVDVDQLVASVADGATLAVPPDYSGPAMEAVRALIRRGVRGLRLVAVPQAGLQADLLIGAGCVETVEAAAVSLGEQGQAPQFRDAVTSGAIEMVDSTCPAIHAGLQAAEKGVPFMPLRGIVGSDIAKHRHDWRLVDNPFAGDDPIILLPAISPDVALFHAALADRDGNVWVGTARELITMAHAAHATLITVEEIVDDSLLEDEQTAAGTLPSLYVTAVAEARHGSWPIGLKGRYGTDVEHLGLYAKQARTDEGFQQYLAQHVNAAESASA